MPYNCKPPRLYPKTKPSYIARKSQNSGERVGCYTRGDGVKWNIKNFRVKIMI